MRVPMLARRTLSIGALLLAGCGSSSQPTDPAPPPSPATAAAPLGTEKPGTSTAADEAALIKLEQDYAQALIARDRAFLVRFYASDWRGGNWLGFWSKATMLQSVLDERYVTKSMQVRDMKVRVMGDVAVVQGIDDEVTRVDGKDTSGKWAFTDIFARRNGRWEAIAGHTSKVQPTGE